MTGKMKKILAVLSCSVLMTCTASALVPASEISLGGIRAGASTYDDVLERYGTPDKSYDRREFNVSYMAYGAPSVEIQSRYQGTVTSVKVTANNGWATPAGVHVGSSVSDILNAYGNPDYKFVDKKANVTIYEWYDTSKMYFMSFATDNRTKTVTQITASMYN